MGALLSTLRFLSRAGVAVIDVTVDEYCGPSTTSSSVDAEADCHSVEMRAGTGPSPTEVYLVSDTSSLNVSDTSSDDECELVEWQRTAVLSQRPRLPTPLGVRPPPVRATVGTGLVHSRMSAFVSPSLHGRQPAVRDVVQYVVGKVYSAVIDILAPFPRSEWFEVQPSDIYAALVCTPARVCMGCTFALVQHDSGRVFLTLSGSKQVTASELERWLCERLHNDGLRADRRFVEAMASCPDAPRLAGVCATSVFTWCEVGRHEKCL